MGAKSSKAPVIGRAQNATFPAPATKTAEQLRIEKQTAESEYEAALRSVQSQVSELVDAWVASKNKIRWQQFSTSAGTSKLDQDLKTACSKIVDTLDQVMKCGENIASITFELVDMAATVAEAAPMGFGMAAKAIQKILNRVKDMDKNEEDVVLLAIEVALVWETFSGIMSATGDELQFYEGVAGRLHTTVLQVVSVLCCF